jgi:hypothetical protein
MWLCGMLEAMGLVGSSACTRVQGEYLWATDVADSDCGVAEGGAGRRRRGRGRGGRKQLLAEQAPFGKSTIARLGGVDGGPGGATELYPNLGGPGTPGGCRLAGRNSTQVARRRSSGGPNLKLEV